MDKTREEIFLENVDKLSTGERAALRRACGKTLEQADGNALAAFYRYLPRDVNRYDEGGWFEGACLRCLWQPDETPAITAERALAAMDAKQDSESNPYRKRMIVLLDTPRDRDGYLTVKLLRIIKLLKQQGFVINCAALIQDLCRWNESYRGVQKKWARAFAPLPEQNGERKGEQ